MLHENELSQSSFKGNARSLLIIFVVAVILDFLITYVNAYPRDEIFYRFINWFSIYVISLLVDKICILIRVFSPKKILNYLPYIVILSGLIDSLNASINYIFDSKLENPEGLYILLTFVSYFISIGVFFYLMSELYRNKIYTFIQSSLKMQEQAAPLQHSEYNQTSTEHKDKIPEQTTAENSIVEKVIKSILSRAYSSGRALSFCLVIMVAIVIIGGGASVGTVALNEFQKVRELEKVRLNMLKLVDQLPTSDSMTNTNVKVIQSAISTTFGDKDNYKDLLTNIQNQSSFSWPDIAMRITLAALTLFLVQIFFHIYKYNQQQESHLFTKAEILELYKETGADQSELRTMLLSKLDTNIKFGKSPTTLLEQIVSVVSRSTDPR